MSEEINWVDFSEESDDQADTISWDSPLKEIEAKSEAESSSSDPISEIGTQNNNTIDTSLFTITFKKKEMGEQVYNPSMGIFVRNVFNSLGSQFTIHAASQIGALRKLFFTTEDIANDTCPSLTDLFENGILKEEYAEKKTPNQVGMAQRMWLEANCILTALYELEMEYARLLPTGPKMQFAWASPRQAVEVENAGKNFDIVRSSGKNNGQINNRISAFKYRLFTGPVASEARLYMKDTSRQRPVVEAKEYTTDKLLDAIGV